MLTLRAAKLSVMAIHHRRLLVKLRALKKAVRATRARVIKSQAGLASALNRINKVKAAARVTLKAVRASPLPYATYDHHHVGCFVDRPQRDLPNRLGSSGDMTPGKCHDLAQAAGFAFYAVQYARECWGGNSYGKYGKSKACTMDCAGDSFTTCGGTWANEVFFVSSSDANASKRARTAFSLVATVRSRAKKAMQNVRRAQNNLKIARQRVVAAVKKARASLVRRALASVRLALAHARFARRRARAAAQAVAQMAARAKILKGRARQVKKSLAELVVRVDADTVANTHTDAMLAALKKLAQRDAAARARWTQVTKPAKKVVPKAKKVTRKAKKVARKAKTARVMSCPKAARRHAADVKAAKAALLVAQLHLTTAKTPAQKTAARSAIFTAQTLLTHLVKRGMPTCINVKNKKARKPLAVRGVTAPANGGEYVQFSPIRVSGKRFDLAFSVTGVENARIAFMAEEDDASEEAYEVVLGMSGDTRSELRLGTNGKIVARDEKAGRLASKRPFWVTLREGVLFVGQGKFGKNSFLSAPVPKLGKTLSVGYAAGQSPVKFRAMKIRRGGKRPTCKSQSKKIARLQRNIRKIERSLYQIKLRASAKKLSKAVKKVQFHLTKALAFAQQQLVADRAIIKGLCQAVRRVGKKSTRPTASPLVFAAAGNNGHYNVFAAKVSRKQFRLSFVAEATNDIHVAFMSSKSDRSASAVEVAIGGWGDNQSVIRQGTQGREVASNTARGQAKACAKGCWIAYKNGQLSVGQKGNTQAFMSAKVTLPAGESLHVALAAWDHPVYFSRVRAA